MIRIYIFIVLFLVVVIGAQISLKTFAGGALASFGFFDSASRGSEYHLAEIDFNFFSSGIKKTNLSQGYGATPFVRSRSVNGWHNGIDITAQTGTPIHSPQSGVVVLTGNQDDFCYKRAYGKFVAIKSQKDDVVFLFAHLSVINVKNKANIKEGQIIGKVGETGFATAPHLHFTVFESKNFRINQKKSCGPTPEGKDINPIKYLESITTGAA